MSSSEEVVTVEVPSFNPADQIFQEAFHAVDKDKNGWLDKKEFREFLRQAGHGKLSKHLFHIIDRDQNGKVSLQEFQEMGRAMWAAATQLNVEPYLKMVFDAVDKGAKGYLTKKEFVKFMTYTGNKVSILKQGKQFKDWDADGDGKLTLSEIMEKFHFVLAQ